MSVSVWIILVQACVYFRVCLPSMALAVPTLNTLPNPQQITVISSKFVFIFTLPELLPDLRNKLRKICCITKRPVHYNEMHTFLLS